MDFFSLASLLFTLAIFIALINYRFIKMQTTVAIMAGSLSVSLFLLIVTKAGFGQFAQPIIHLITTIPFEHILLNVMLGFLLFAGSLTIDLHTLRQQRGEIAILASISTLASTFLIGVTTYYLLPFIGLKLSFLMCLLFGALISPTDPIAVLSMFKQIRVPKKLETTIAGESLFNDGVGIVLFLSFYYMAFTHVSVTPLSILLLFGQQALGGILYGFAIGQIGSWSLKKINDHQLQILVTIAIVMGGYSLTKFLHVSGPLAMVVAGIIVGHHLRKSIPTLSQTIIKNFWEIIDEIFNCILFLLIGFELLVVVKNNYFILAAVSAIPLVLAIRYLTVAIPLRLFKGKKQYSSHTVRILVWGGLRGGLAVALALSLPESIHRQLILSMTYGVVTFSVLIQGLTIAPLVKLSRLMPTSIANIDPLAVSKEEVGSD